MFISNVVLYEYTYPIPIQRRLNTFPHAYIQMRGNKNIQREKKSFIIIYFWIDLEYQSLSYHISITHITRQKKTHNKYEK